ncbi:MAG: hypothetical protein ACKVX7_11825 [Planctomycetota bacterium]
MRYCRVVAAFLGAMLVMGRAVDAQDSLSIDAVTLIGPAGRVVAVRMDASQAVEAFTLAIAYPQTLVDVSDIAVAGVAAAAAPEGVFPEIFPAEGGFIFGVFLDILPPFAGQTIAAGLDLEIATFIVTPLAAASTTVFATLDWADDLFGSPPVLNELIFAGGMPVGVAQGLTLESATVTLLPGDLALSLTDVSISGPDGGDSFVELDNSVGPVEAYVLAVGHPPLELELTSVDIVATVAESLGAEFVTSEILALGGIIAVVLDSAAPFLGQTIPTGNDARIARLHYECSSPPVQPAPPAAHAIVFVDGLLGTPPVANTITIDGIGVVPTSRVGALVTCVPLEPADTVFAAGGYDATAMSVVPLAGRAGETVELAFFYTDPADELQGFQIAVEYDCLLALAGEFSIAGGVLESIGVEFISSDIDADFADGDGCEFIAGILLDALPPFLGQTAPAATTPQQIASIGATIAVGVPVGTLLAIDFVSGLDGSGTIPIENIVVIDFASVAVVNTVAGSVEVIADAAFRRGDCNNDGQFDVADAVAIVSHAFLGEPVNCLAACDTDSSGRSDVADCLVLANYLFLAGPPPTAPFPLCGTAPAAACDAYSHCP